MSVHDGFPVAGRPLPDEEIAESRETVLGTTNAARLRQRTLYEYTTREGERNTSSRTKSNADFVVDKFAAIPWGDPVASGNSIEETGTFRLISHNVNGLSTADQQADVLHFANAIADKAVSVFGIQETNQNFERNNMVTSFHKVINSVSTHHQGAVSSAKMQWPQDYQPGGTAVSVLNRFATRFLEKGSDDLGRWSWITLAGQGQTKITFISAYRVCDGAPEAAITSRTVRAQQEWMYADRGVSSINLRLQFVTDLTKLIQQLQAAGHDIVLMMDVNEPSGHGSAVDRFIYACGLVDAHTRSTEALEPPPTYHRGSSKIDFVLVSPRVAQAITSRTILPIHDGYLSDHRALLVDFDASRLFAGPTSDVVPPKARQLTSTNPTVVKWPACRRAPPAVNGTTTTPSNGKQSMAYLRRHELSPNTNAAGKNQDCYLGLLSLKNPAKHSCTGSCAIENTQARKLIRECLIVLRRHTKSRQRTWHGSPAPTSTRK
jgi:exonuclease III